MKLREIAEKYIYGRHDALTDSQEIKDMMEDIENYADEQVKLNLPVFSHQRELLICYIMNEQKLYCGKPDRKLSEELADNYISSFIE